MSQETPTAAQVLRSDLARLARFGANITDAHSCFIFLPRRLIASSSAADALGADGPTHVGRVSEDPLSLGGVHSLSADVFRECELPRGSGLIGWVAKHVRAIHVSPFERDSRTLGVYSLDQQLKSFIGIPIPLGSGPTDAAAGVGVVACDSKKAFAFSKVQGKLLEDLASEIARYVELTALSEVRSTFEGSWDVFVARGEQLLGALGANSVEVVRLRPVNFGALERALGLGEAITLLERTMRLIEQTLPPHSPVVRLPNGDILLVVDNMMAAFYEGKIRAICGHVGVGQGAKIAPEFDFVRGGGRRKRGETVTLHHLIVATNQPPTQLENVVGAEGYGHRRA